MSTASTYRYNTPKHRARPPHRAQSRPTSNDGSLTVTYLHVFMRVTTATDADLPPDGPCMTTTPSARQTLAADPSGTVAGPEWAVRLRKGSL